MPVLLGPRRRHRDHRRGAPQPVRHARAEHAPGAAERGVPGLHRHAADRGRGADPRGVRRLRHRSTTSATPSRTARRSRSTTRTASPSCSSSTRTSTTSSPSCSRRPSSTRTPRASSPAASAREYTLITRPSGCARSPRTSSRHFVGRGLHRQGDVRRRSTRPPRCACTTYVARGVGRAPGRAARRSTTRCPSWSGRGWRAGSRSWRRPTWRSSCRRPRTRSPTSSAQGLDITPHRKRMIDEDLDERFKDADDPLRLVFVCAMWMTGFDAPSVLDDLPRPADAQPHADADDRPGQPGLPREGQRADRRLRRRVPEPREGARDLRRRQRRGRRRLADPGRRALVAALERRDRRAGRALRERYGRRPRRAARRDGVRAHRPARRRGRGAAGRRGDADRRSSAAARQVRKLFKALLPDPAAAAHQHTVAAIRVLAERIARRRPAADGRPRRRSPTPSTSCSTARSAPRST